MGISDVKTGGFWAGCEALFRPTVFQGQWKDSFREGLICLDRNIFAPWARGKYTHLPSHHYKTGWKVGEKATRAGQWMNHRKKRRKTSHKAYHKEIIPQWIQQCLPVEPGIQPLVRGSWWQYHIQFNRQPAGLVLLSNHVGIISWNLFTV